MDAHTSCNMHGLKLAIDYHYCQFEERVFAAQVYKRISRNWCNDRCCNWQLAPSVIELQFRALETEASAEQTIFVVQKLDSPE